MLKGVVIEDFTMKGQTFKTNEEVVILGAEYSNLYPTKEFYPILMNGVKTYAPKKCIRIINK